MRKEIFNMTQKEISRLRVINQTIDRVITIREAARILNLSERQVLRLKKGVVNQGPAFIIHKNRGRKPKHAICDEIKKKVVELKKSKYEEANFAHFKELLEEREGICLSYSSVHRTLTSSGIKSPKKHRKRKVHHRRKRKPQKGLLVQIDASPHEWIIGGGKFALHGAIDDATGEILALFFAPTECMEGYFEIARQIVLSYGIPVCFYSDRHTIFRSPNSDKLSVEDQLEGKRVNPTQFERAMEELGISIIHAGSCQAKGRIERLWQTLQSRLPVEFKIRGIDSLETANAFLSKFMASYNNKFAVEPENPKSAFRRLDPSINLDLILCIKKKRTIIEGSAFSYEGKYYQLMESGKKASALTKAKITVLVSSKIGVKAVYAGKVYDTLVLNERPKKKVLKQSRKQKHNYKPAADHPWNQTQKSRPMVSYEETDREILERVNQLFNSTRAWA